MIPFTQLIHPEGWRFVIIFSGITIFLTLFSQTLGWLGAMLTGWCFYFFRNPTRVTPEREGLIVSPADGKIVSIREVTPPSEWNIGETPRIRISIFLNIFDVHINRIPVSGLIQKALYHPGKFFNASLDKASEHNERNILIINLEHDKLLAVVQIAGLIARRIRCDVKEGDTVKTGSQYGIIRFGSRTDIYLPIGVSSLVSEGQRVLGGETVIADTQSNEPARQGSIV